MATHFMVTRIQDPIILCYLIGFIVLLSPIFGFIAPKGLAPAIIFGGIAGIIILRIKKQKIEWLNKSLIMILFGVCFWSLVTSFWAINTESAVLGTAKLLGNFLTGGLFFTVFQNLEDPEKNLISKCVFIGFIFVLCIIISEILTGSALYAALKFHGSDYVPINDPNILDKAWLNTAVVVLSLFVWPVALLHYKKNLRSQLKKRTILLIICFFSSILIISIQIGFLSGAVAIILGIIGAGLIINLGQRTGAKVFLIVIILSSFAPFGFKYFGSPIALINSVVSIPYSAQHRVGIWKFTTSKILEKPISGWGMNASRDIPGGRSILLAGKGKQFGRALPLHPHNAILQIWLELGFPGIVLFISLLGLILLKVVKLDYSKFEAAMIFGQIATILVIANLSFGIWQAWWIATLWLSASVMLLAVRFNSAGDS